MDKNEIFKIIKGNVLELVPEINESDVTIKSSLKELGLNSIDRADVLTNTLEALNIKMDLLKFGSAKNIEDITDIIRNDQ